MDLITSNNSKLYLGTTTVMTTTGEYEADTWQEIGNIEDLGEFGDSAEIISFLALSDGRVRKAKGAFDAGEQQIVIGYDPTDQGLIDLIAAKDDTGNAYNIKIERDDQITPTTGNPTTHFFRAVVGSVRYQYGTANNIQRAQVNLGISSEILELAAV